MAAGDGFERGSAHDLPHSVSFSFFIGFSSFSSVRGHFLYLHIQVRTPFITLLFLLLSILWLYFLLLFSFCYCTSCRSCCCRVFLGGALGCCSLFLNLLLPALFFLVASLLWAEAAVAASFPAPVSPYVAVSVEPPAEGEDLVSFFLSSPLCFLFSVRKLTGHYHCFCCSAWLDLRATFLPGHTFLMSPTSPHDHK